MSARASLQLWGLVCVVLGAGAQFHLDPPLPEGAECGRIKYDVWTCQKESRCADLSNLVSSGRRITCSTNSAGVRIVCCPPGSSSPNRIQGSISEIKCAEYQRARCGDTSKNSETGVGSAFSLGSGGPISFEGAVTNDEETSDSGAIPDVAILGGVPASIKEFPHSAIVGYGDEADIKWRCGGTLISERFVLSAAHCAITSTFTGPPRWVLLGDEDYKTDTDDSQPQRFAIAEIIVHQGYKEGEYYNDIVLFRLDREAEFTDHVAPACLQASDPSALLTAAGYGKVETHLGSSQLRKVNISLVPTEECQNQIPVVGNLIKTLPSGVNGELMLCAGGYGKDTCEGDSGGPLVLADKGGNCLAQLVGVTSFGPRGCEARPAPGVYVRVAHFIPWIESIVWPNHDKTAVGSAHTE